MEPISMVGHAGCADDRSWPPQPMLPLIDELFPICRSITGQGLRQTLARIRQEIPLEIHELASGTPVFDWTVPREWNIRDAYIMNLNGERIVDFRQNNLHVVNYSVPVKQRMRRDELMPKLHSLSNQPDWIPYRTSYYAEDWGFCLSDRVKQQMLDDEYDVCIDADLSPGAMSWGEYLIPGLSDRECIFSAHVCHPSLANDNLAGIAVACRLAQYIQQLPQRHYSYRFLFMPGTIGTIAWLATHADVIPRVRAGLVLALLGQDRPFTFKQTRQPEHEFNAAVEMALRDVGCEYQVMPFEPYGYDERQYNSPGIGLPVACLMRSRYGGYPEYHTSADHPDLLQEDRLHESWEVCRRVVDIWENNRYYRNLAPYCEPQLGKRGLYDALGGRSDRQALQQALLWVLHLADGCTTVIEMSRRSKLPLDHLHGAIQMLLAANLLEEGSSHEAW